MGQLSPVLCRQSIKMADGVKLADEISDEYCSMKTAKKYRYIIFHIQDEKTIVIESTGGRDSTYDEYLEKLPDDACKFGLYDLEFQHGAQGGEESLRQMLLLMSWSPDEQKMLYSSSFPALKKALEGVGQCI